MEDKVMVGLDVGSSKVYAVVGKLDSSENLEILGIGQAEIRQSVEKGLVRNITKTAEAIQAALNEADNNSNILIGEVITNISYQQVDYQELTDRVIINNPEIQHSDVERILENVKKHRVPMGSSILHICPQEFKVDEELFGEVYSPVGMPGVHLSGKFLAITTPTIAIDHLDKTFKDLGTKVAIKDRLFSALASSISTLNDEEKEAGVAIVDIGAGTTDIAIFYKNICRFVCTLPFGGNDITSDIQIGCGVLPDIAEKLKVGHGVALSHEVPLEEVVSVPGLGTRGAKEVSLKNLSIIIEERLKEMASLIYAKIIKSGYSEKLGGGIVLTGGTSQMIEIERLFSKISGKDVRVGQPNIKLSNAGNSVEFNPSHATAIGLLWKGFKSYDSRKDDIIKEKEKAKQKNVKVNAGLDFETPVSRNIFKTGFAKIKDIFKEDSNKMDDGY